MQQHVNQPMKGTSGLAFYIHTFKTGTLCIMLLSYLCELDKHRNVKNLINNPRQFRVFNG